MKKIVISAAVLFLACQATITAQNASAHDLHSAIDTISYCIGVSVGNSLGSLPVKDVRADLVCQGMMDLVEKKTAFFTNAEAEALLREYMLALREKESKDNLQAANDFLAANGKNEGVVSLPSGLQYKVITPGAGESPIATDNVTVNYKGTLIDGTVFDSSYDRNEPATFPLNKVIKGWTEGVQLMKPGAKYQFFIPPQLGYGENPPQGSPIKVNDVLIFEVELLSVQKQETK